MTQTLNDYIPVLIDWVERDVIRQEILQVLASGHHEKAKDEYVERFAAWNYAIRGKTLDGRELRVAVGFEGAMLIITVIDLKV